MNSRFRLYLLFALTTPAFGAATQPATISDVHVATNGDKVAVEVTLSDSITPTLTFAKNPDRLIADFPNVSPKERLQHIPVGKNGVERVRIGLNHANPPVTRVVVDLDSLRPFTVEASDRKVLLNIHPASAKPTSEAGSSKAADTESTSIAELSPNTVSGSNFPVIKASAAQSRPARATFKIKGIAADSVYIDGGTNSGLQVGMRLIVHDPVPGSNRTNLDRGPFAAELRILAVAATSAVAEVHEAKRTLKRGEIALLTPEDAQAARTAWQANPSLRFAFLS